MIAFGLGGIPPFFSHIFLFPILCIIDILHFLFKTYIIEATLKEWI